MKNTLSNQLNQKNAKLNNLCVITYLGKNITLTKEEDTSFELFVRETFHKFIKRLVKVAQVFNQAKFREGRNSMRDLNKYALSEKVNELCPKCPQKANVYTEWDNTYKQKLL